MATRVLQRDLELRELGLLFAQLATEGLDLGPHRPDALVGRAGFGVLETGYRAQPATVALDGALGLVELVAELLPARELFGVRGPVALADRPERVRAVADRLRRLGAETVDPHAANGSRVVAGSGGVHLPGSIRAGHGQTIR